MEPQTRYARSGDVAIAHQVVVDGPHDVVAAPGFTSHVELFPRRGFRHRLAAQGTRLLKGIAGEWALLAVDS